MYCQTTFLMTKEDYMHLPKERLAEMLAERDKIDAQRPTYEPYIYPWKINNQTFPPCFAHNGICTNPQHDCVNCPRLATTFTFGTTTTTTTDIDDIK